MILIKSNPNDPSADEVVEWIHSLKGKFLRIDDGNDVVNATINMGGAANSACSIKLKFRDRQEVDLGKVSSFWQRRGQFKFEFSDELKSELSRIKFMVSGDLAHFQKLEWQVIEAFISRQLYNETISLHNPDFRSINKLEQLLKAASLGIDIPQTLVTTDKNEVREFARPKITKPLKESIRFILDEHYFQTFTAAVSDEDVETLAEQFSPSYFQEHLDKAYELRVFYLNGTCYAMAIFSQQDQQTQLDFKNYNANKPNRNVPYQLPTQMEEKIGQLMTLLKLKTGSLDFVVTQSGRYVFLEVNPVGQFGFVSHACNYRLEKKIAQALMPCHEEI